MNSKPQTVVDLSSLTRVQVETLQLHIAIRESQINMQEALKKRKNVAISRGTHYRILDQARKNIRESLFTVAVAVQIGLLKQEDVQKLISSVSAIPADLEAQKLAEIIPLVKVLANRIVMS
jgi:predicted DNA-binding protein (UPF0251 family)